jgi:hypothetical protein
MNIFFPSMKQDKNFPACAVVEQGKGDVRRGLKAKKNEQDLSV